MSDALDCSPKWKKPGDVMKKIYLRKRKIPIRSASLSEVSEFNKGKDNAKSLGKRSKNPFAKKRFSSDSVEQDKKRVLSVSDETASSLPEKKINDSVGLSVFDTYDDICNDNENNALDFVYLNEDSFLGIVNVSAGSNNGFANFRKSALPTDWTLKSKARFLSSSSFFWCARIKGAEEAEAISLASRCVENENNSNHRVELGKNLMYWQHPYIPWFSLFPRFGSGCGLVTASGDEPSLSEDAKSNLYDSWVVAFRSVYQLLRQNLCPFFYVCSQQYTALFRCPAITQSEIHCLLTPTSLGFRKALKSHGITFSTPMQSQIETATKSAPNSEANDCHNRPYNLANENKENKKGFIRDETAEESSQDEPDSDEEQEWKNISENLSFRKSRKLVTAASEDGLPNTAVLVEGSANTQLLFNYLLNSRSSISISGRQAGMPPTILAPVSFNGATLRKLDSRAGIAKIRTNSSRSTSGETRNLESSQHFSLDISGPIMPHHLNGIFHLLANTQENGDYSASFGNYTNTAPFNASYKDISATKSASFVSENLAVLSNRDFAQSFLKNLDFDASSVSMRIMNALNGTYEWEV